MDIGLVSLIILIVVILLGFVRKLNVGILAIAAATLLGSVSGQFTSKEIIGGFSASLFMHCAGKRLSGIGDEATGWIDWSADLGNSDSGLSGWIYRRGNRPGLRACNGILGSDCHSARA